MALGEQIPAGPAQAALPSQEDKLDLCFRDPVFLQRYGGGIPDAGAALDYLSLSPDFYVPSCINEQVKMQSRFSSLSSAALDISKMTGIEYYTWYSDVARQNFHLVKQYKHSPTSSSPMAAFYILGGTIYQAPDLHTLFASRMRASLTHLMLAFKQFTDFAKFDPSSGYHWDSVGPAPAAATTQHPKPSQPSKSGMRRHLSKDYAARLRAEYQSRVDMLIHDSAQTQHVQLIEKPQPLPLENKSEKLNQTPDALQQPPTPSVTRASTSKSGKVRSVAGSSTVASTSRRHHKRRRNKDSESATDAMTVGGESRHSRRSQKSSKKQPTQKPGC